MKMETIYDFNSEEILSNLMNREDVKYYLKKGNFTIYTFNDYISILKDNGLLEEELNGRTLEEFKEDMENDNIGADHRSGYYHGCDYVVEFWG